MLATIPRADKPKTKRQNKTNEMSRHKRTASFMSKSRAADTGRTKSVFHEIYSPLKEVICLNNAAKGYVRCVGVSAVVERIFASRIATPKING